MKKKIVVGIFVYTLLIATVLPVAATQNVDENEAPSCGLAMTPASSEMAEVQIQNDVEGLNERAVPFYGYCAWDPSGTLVQGPVSFNPTTPGNITQVAPTSSTEFIPGGTWVAGKWYGCEYALGVGQPLIWTIHPVNGTMTQVGSYDPDGTGLSFNGLAYDPTTGIMYGCSSTDLYKVNIATGASSWVGNLGIPGSIMIAIAFDGSGNLYGTELITDSLYSINLTNGVATPIGSGLGININYAQDMAFDIDTGILYLSAYTIAPIKEGALYTCNTVTGVATKVGTFQGAAEITGFAISYNYSNQPPDTPIIDGPTSGKAGTEYEYTFSATDPNDHDVKYYVDWDDGTTEETTFHGSGEIVTLNHTWNKQRTYIIKAKAEDIFGESSNWSEFEVTMPRNKAFNFNLLEWLFERFPNAFPILKQLLGL